MKVGDKVRVIKDDSGIFKPGELAEIIKVDRRYPAPYRIKIDGHENWMYEDEIEVVNEVLFVFNPEESPFMQMLKRRRETFDCLRYAVGEKKEKERLPMKKLEGYFCIEEKDNGYVVTVDAEGYSSTVVDENSIFDGASRALGQVISVINLERQKEENRENEIKRLKERLAELEG